MLKIGKESKLKPEEAIKKAVDFFGPGGYGLEVEDEGNCCSVFKGGGGSVRVSAYESGKGSTVDVEAVEWEVQAKEFMSKLK